MNASSSRNSNISAALFAGCLAATVLAAGLLGGCAKEEPPPVVIAPPPPPPPPPPPQVRSVADLMAELRIDPRVEMYEDRAPNSTAERKAILEFFDAFARGDDNALSRMLDPRDRRELVAMVESGEWKRATENIARIEIYQTGSSPEGRPCALALFEVDFDYQPQLWYYTRDGESFRFAAAPTTPGIGIMRDLSGEDWIAAWHEVLLDEYDIAARPDLAVIIPQRILDEARDTGVGRSDDAPPLPGGPQPGDPQPSDPSPAPDPAPAPAG